MRMLDNCSLETETVKLIQDDLQYYLECNQEPDFAENELIYEDLELDDGPNSETTVCTCECVSVWNMNVLLCILVHVCVYVCDQTSPANISLVPRLPRPMAKNSDVTWANIPDTVTFIT